MRRTLVASAALVVWLAAGTAAAEDDARALFEAGVKAAARGAAAEACAFFDRSYALQPAIGSELNVAGCREQAGDLVGSYNLFAAARARAEREGKPERRTMAEARLRALEPKVARLALRGRDLEGADVSVDGRPAADLVERPLAVTPGTHAVELRRGQGTKQRVFRATAAAKVGEQAFVDVPGDDAGRRVDAAPREAPPPEAPAASVGVAPWLLLGGGAAASIVSTATGVMAIGKKSDADAAFGAGDVDRANHIVEEGKPLATVSTIGAVAAVALVGAGIVWLVVAPRERAPSAARLWVTF